MVSPHGMLDSWALRNSGWKKKIAGYAYENRHLSGAACLHALHKAEASSIRDLGLQNPICIIPNGVDIPEEPALTASKEKVCLYLGRLHPKKGISMLLHAWAKIRPVNWKLELAGWGRPEHEQEFRNLACSLKLGDSVRFLGPRFGAEKDSCFRKAAALILPSVSEGLPVAVLEAWSYGLPVAITPQCNLAEGYATGAAIRLEGNVDGLVAALATLFTMNEAELHEMGVRGKQLVRQRYSWECVSAQMLAVYKWVLEGAPKPDCVCLV
jgi:poly(glycerol-phosphate) alpha-glucosyltransferase